MKSSLALFAVLLLQNIVNTRCFADFLNVQTFDRLQSRFVLFYAPWCTHCKQLLPTWNDLAVRSQEQNKWNNMKISKVNCAEDTEFCSNQNIVAYPTMKLFHDGGSKRFDGRRSLTELEIFIEKVLNYKVEIEEVDGLLTLTSENFDAHIKDGVALHFIDFYAPWCIHCKRLEPIWKAIAEHYKDNPDITIAKIDCTVETSKCQRWGIKGFPTLDLIQNGHLVDRYQGSRDLESLKTYINDQLYRSGLSVNVDSLREAEENKEPPIDPEKMVYVQSDMIVDPDEDTIHMNPVVEVHDRTFDMLVGQEKTFINFYTPSSEASKEFHETWKELGIVCQKEGLMTIAQINCFKYSHICKKYQVSQYPTLILFEQGTLHYYNQEKTLKSLYNFVKQHMHDEL